MQHFITTADWDQSSLQEILDQAEAFRRGAASEAIEKQISGLDVFQPPVSEPELPSNWACGKWAVTP